VASAPVESVAFLASISIMAEEAKVTLDGHVTIGVAAVDHAAICCRSLCDLSQNKQGGRGGGRGGRMEEEKRE